VILKAWLKQQKTNPSSGRPWSRRWPVPVAISRRLSFG